MVGDVIGVRLIIEHEDEAALRDRHAVFFPVRDEVVARLHGLVAVGADDRRKGDEILVAQERVGGVQIADLGGVAVEIGVVDVQRRFVAVLVVVRFLRQIGVCRPERELPAVRFGGGEDCGQTGKQRGRAEEQEKSFAFAHRNNVLPFVGL